MVVIINDTGIYLIKIYDFIKLWIEQPIIHHLKGTQTKNLRLQLASKVQ